MGLHRVRHDCSDLAAAAAAARCFLYLFSVPKVSPLMLVGKARMSMTAGSNFTSPLWADSQYQPCMKAQGGRRYGLVKYSFRTRYST